VKINLHIERIVVEGIDLTRRERQELATTIEQELIRRLRGRLGDHPAPPGRPEPHATGASDESPLGVRIARDLFAALPVQTHDEPPQPAARPATARPTTWPPANGRPAAAPTPPARPAGPGAVGTRP